MKILENINGMTIRELKDWLAAVPDVDANGEACEVWIETARGCSSPVVRAIPLNLRGESCDLLLESTAREAGLYVFAAPHPQITKVLGQHIGLNADWINCAWLIYANADKSGSWFLVEDEETPNTFNFGFRASTPDATFEIHETISTHKALTEFLDNLHGIVAGCRHVDLG